MVQHHEVLFGRCACALLGWLTGAALTSDNRLPDSGPRPCGLPGHHRYAAMIEVGLEINAAKRLLYNYYFFIKHTNQIPISSPVC